jgi:hypothetical protein
MTGDGDGTGGLAEAWSSPRHEIPVAPECVECKMGLEHVFGWCAGCRQAFCFPCGRRHFCHPTCEGNGCLAGYCVREVRDGLLSPRWGLPPD